MLFEINYDTAHRRSLKHKLCPNKVHQDRCKTLDCKKKNDNNFTDWTVSAENEFILSQQGLRRNESIRGELNWVMICISWEKGDKQDCLRIEFSIPRYLKFLEAKYRDIHSLKWN